MGARVLPCGDWPSVGTRERYTRGVRVILISRKIHHSTQAVSSADELTQRPRGTRPWRLRVLRAGRKCPLHVVVRMISRHTLKEKLGRGAGRRPPRAWAKNDKRARPGGARGWRGVALDLRAQTAQSRVVSARLQSQTLRVRPSLCCVHAHAETRVSPRLRSVLCALARRSTTLDGGLAAPSSR